MSKMRAPALTLRGIRAREDGAADIFLDPPVLETGRLRLRRMRMPSPQRSRASAAT